MLQVSAPFGRKLSFSSFRSCAAAAAAWSLNWSRTWRVVRTPTSTANAARITNVSAADPPASRQRIGNDLYAENVARAADRMEEPRLATCFKLPSKV